MKAFAIQILFITFFCQVAYAQLQIERISIEANLGLGISLQPDKNLSPPLTSMGNVTAETSRGWILAAEVGQTHFRSATFPRKVQGFYSELYLRNEHVFYGIRFGKSFQLDSSRTKFVLSTGLNSLQLIEPIQVRPGGFGVNVDKSETYCLNVPAQIDFWIPIKQNQNKCFVVSARGNMNACHSFLIFGIGLKGTIYSKLDKIRLFWLNRSKALNQKHGNIPL